MARRAGPRPFAPALERVADAVMPATLLAEVQRTWPAVAGNRLAAVAEPVSERDGVVTVACGSAVWAQELDLLSERVVEALNQRLGRPAVRRLRAVATPPPG
jgi:predicted nucleic acid-binding Zn ribbon protein